MTIEKIRLSDLIPDDRNANKGTERGESLLQQSLESLGAGRSLLVDKQGRAIAGNKTLRAAIDLGYEEAIVVETDGSHLVVVKRTDLDLDEEKARQLAIADNRVGELSLSWDVEVLQSLAKEIDLSSYFEESEIQELVKEVENLGRDDGELKEEELGDPDDLNLRCERGELWALGEHRLIVGDSTCQEDILRLLACESASLCWTDPPYNVNYDPEARASSFGSERQRNPLGTIANDSMSDEDFRAFLELVYCRIDEVLIPGSPIYICHADKMGHLFRGAFLDRPWKLQSCLIWKKNNFTLGRSDYHWMHEPILYGWKTGEGHKYYGDRCQTTILEFASAHHNKKECDTDGYIHPTQKPVDLIEYCIKNSSQEGEIVLDLFGGSGSTLIACEKTNRVARLCEISPKFATLILNRWENFTGKEAQRIDG